MRCRYPLAGLAAIAVLASSVAIAQARPNVAILGLEVVDDSGSGIDSATTKLAKDLTRALRERARQEAGPYGLANNSDRDLLEMKLLSGCTDEATPCMAKIGDQLGAEFLLYGRISKRKRGYQVTLVLLNVKNTDEKRETTDVIQFSDVSKSRITMWSRRLYNQVTGVPERGDLIVRANVDRGTVYVDGEIKGSLSSGKVRISGLKTGRHEVQIETKGHKPYTADVTIKSAETETVRAELEPRAVGEPDEPIGDGKGPEEGGGGRTGFKIAAWALTAVSLAGGGFWYQQSRVVSKNLAIVDDAEITPPTGSNNPCEAMDLPDNVATACTDGSKASTNTYIAGAVTIVAGTAALVSFYFGYIGGGSSSSKEKLGRNGRTGSTRTVDVVPTITPDYAGGTVRIEF